MSAEGLASPSARRDPEANASEIRSMGDLDEGFDCKSAYSCGHAFCQFLSVRADNDRLGSLAHFIS